MPPAFPYNVLAGARPGYTGGKVDEFDAPKVTAA